MLQIRGNCLNSSTVNEFVRQCVLLCAVAHTDVALQQLPYSRAVHFQSIDALQQVSTVAPTGKKVTMRAAFCVPLFFFFALFNSTGVASSYLSLNSSRRLFSCFAVSLDPFCTCAVKWTDPLC